MKRYLYILLAAVMAVVACEPVVNVPEPEVAVNFGEISVKAKDTSAVVKVSDTYLTLDGERYDDAKVWVEYTFEGSDMITPVKEYAEEGDCLTFTINNLMPLSDYELWVVVDGGEYGKHVSDMLGFATTEEHIPFSGISCDVDVEAKGIIAELSLSNVAYVVDDVELPLDAVRVEYQRKNAEEWIAHEYAASAFVDGAHNVHLPFEGEEYLLENREYSLRVTLLTSDSSHEPLTTPVHEFRTYYAEVTANIATPVLSCSGEGIYASVDNIEIFYDGVSECEYTCKYDPIYMFNYRLKGVEEWSKISVEAVNGAISTSIPIDVLERGKTYQVKAVVRAGAKSVLCDSQIAEVAVPEAVAPTPPVEGGGDTSSIAGTWHLT